MEPGSVTIKQQSNHNHEDFLFNPFPGLRPFSTEESHLFFGREGQSQEVLKFLAQNRFVALLGTSGSGKSSLMYCGVIPILQGGFITKAGADWKIITCRPGQSPVRNLSISLASHFSDDLSTELQKEFIYSTLTASSVGLLEMLKQVPRKPNQNILLLVDQFEELFRFRKIKNSIEAYNETLAYIKLLLEVLNQHKLPVYITLTMRSDFIGECAQFQDLTKLINDSHYLIPQMTRDNFRQAIEGPVAVGGGTITPFLVQQLLNDIGDNPDQLPTLQHALMRTWDSWIKAGHSDEPLDIKDYENIGGLEKALSEHANEAYNELSQEQKDICQSIFKTITEKGGDNRGVRRPTSVSEIAEIAVCSANHVFEVVEHFRSAGRSFLTPAAGIELTTESIIDISHESLMRIWDKLIIWVSEEYEAVQMYKRLADSALKYQLGETALWRPPDLQLALNWREKQKPTLTWAKRHNPAFERTMVFLETSYKEYQLEEENKIKQQKKALRRTRMFAIVLGTASIISLFFMINSFLAKQEAEKQKLAADQQTEIAKTERIKAEEQTKFAEEQKALAQQKEKEAVKQTNLAETERKKALRSAQEALRQKEIANNKSIEATQQRQAALESAEEAKKQQNLAEAASLQAQKLRMLSISQSMAVKSNQIDIDTTLRALVAYQSYLFNTEFQGNVFNSDIYNGLYFAQKYLYGNKLTDFVGHKYSVRALAMNTETNEFYSTGSGGKIMKWKQDDNTDSSQFYSSPNINRVLTLSPDNKFMAVGNDNGEVLVFNLSITPPAPELVYSHTDAVISLVFTTNDQLISSSIKGNVVITNLNSKKTEDISTDLVLRDLVATDKGYLALGGKGSFLIIQSLSPLQYKEYQLFYSEDGKNSSLEKSDSKSSNYSRLATLNAFSLGQNKNLLALGDIDGNVLVYDFNTLKPLNRLTGHTARINSIQFDKNNRYLATASNDGTILMWETADFNQVPFTFADNDAWVMTMMFTSDGTGLLGAYADGKIRKWYTSIEPLAKNVVKKIKRNLTTEEWQQYVAKDIEYKKTISQLP